MKTFDPTCPACFMEHHNGHDLGLRHDEGELYSATCHDCNETFQRATEPMREFIAQDAATPYEATGWGRCDGCETSRPTRFSPVTRPTSAVSAGIGRSTMPPDTHGSAERGSAPATAASAVLSPDEYGALLAIDLTSYDAQRPRSKQADAGILGVSDIYTCREKVRRLILGMNATDVTDSTAAIIGTYIHEGVTAARRALRPDLLHDVEVKVTLPNGFVLPGHADEADPSEPSVTDYKSKDGLDLTRRAHSDEHDTAQRHLYYLGLMQAGIITSDKGVVRNVYLDRSGSDGHPHVEQEPFSMDVVLAAQEWLSEPLYAAEHGQDAPKDWPRPKCQRWCQFFTACRGHDQDGEDYLTGHRAVVLAEMVAAKDRKKEAAAVYEQARDELMGVTGNSDAHWVRSTVVNAKTPYIKVEVGSHEDAA